MFEVLSFQYQTEQGSKLLCSPQITDFRDLHPILTHCPHFPPLVLPQGLDTGSQFRLEGSLGAALLSAASHPLCSLPKDPAHA